MTNCINCGAPLSGYICEYCGSEFGFPKHETDKKELKREIDLAKSKVKYLHSITTIQKLYEEAIQVMRSYYCD